MSCNEHLQVEVWECRACGDEAPCRVEITFSDTKMPQHLKGRQRFTRMVCLCGETPTPFWDRKEEGPKGMNYDTHSWPENQNCVGCSHAFWQEVPNDDPNSMCRLGQPDPAHCRLREDEEGETDE